MTITCPHCHRTFHKYISWKRSIVVVLLAVVFALVCVEVFNTFRKKLGQHPEDAYSPALFEEELQLLSEIRETRTPHEVDVFENKVWPKYSGWSREAYVPWACFMSREQQIEKRIRRMEHWFRIAEEDLDWVIDFEKRKRAYNTPSPPPEPEWTDRYMTDDEPSGSSEPAANNSAGPWTYP